MAQRLIYQKDKILNKTQILSEYIYRSVTTKNKTERDLVVFIFP